MNFWALAVMLGASSALAERPVIDVLGKRPERVASEHAGQGEVIRPIEPTRFDTKVQLEQNSALAVPETGQVTAAGFAVPRIRGQDTRLTEVYVEDILLEDPFTGLPLVDELDLRAFGELVLSQGVAPPELATVSPIGVVQYRVLPFKGRSLTLGDSFGRPYGNASWLLGAEGRKDGEAQWDTRLYARAHRTDGKYRFYDDNATPYNTADDRYRTRANNDRASQAVLPSLHYADGRNELRTLGLWEGSRRGLPTDFAVSPSHARTEVRSGLGSVVYQRHFTDAAVGASLGVTQDRRQTKDPERIFLAKSAQDFKVLAKRGNLAGDWQSPKIWQASLHADLGTTRAQVSDGDRQLARTAETAYLGLALKPLPELLLEAKYGLRAHTDRKPASAFRDLAYDEAAFTTRHARGGGGSLAVAYDAGGVRPYAQWGKVERLPSLLEELGDGASVRPAPNLKPERARHLEAGVSAVALARTARAGVAVFEDLASDRITLQPAIGQSLRAENIGKTRVRGTTINLNLFSDRPTRPSVSWTALEPRDLTGAHAKQLPGVPERQATLGLEHIVGPAVLRWTSHQRSRVYRDPRNEVIIPGYWLHDLSADGVFKIAGIALAAGLAVSNITDVTREPIAAAGGGSHGETGLSDVSGYPLPGRQWRLDLSCAL